MRFDTIKKAVRLRLISNRKITILFFLSLIPVLEFPPSIKAVSLSDFIVLIRATQKKPAAPVSGYLSLSMLLLITEEKSNWKVQLM